MAWKLQARIDKQGYFKILCFTLLLKSFIELLEYLFTEEGV